jgi:hypothetical protein
MYVTLYIRNVNLVYQIHMVESHFYTTIRYAMAMEYTESILHNTSPFFSCCRLPAHCTVSNSPRLASPRLGSLPLPSYHTHPPLIPALVLSFFPSYTSSSSSSYTYKHSLTHNITQPYRHHILTFLPSSVPQPEKVHPNPYLFPVLLRRQLASCRASCRYF